MMINKNLNYLNSINGNNNGSLSSSYTPRLINSSGINTSVSSSIGGVASGSVNGNANGNANGNVNGNANGNANGAIGTSGHADLNTTINTKVTPKLQLEKRFFEEKSLIKPWLQTQLNPLGINIVIERSDDSKIVFKCKNLNKSFHKVSKINKLDKAAKSKHVCPFRIRANYSLRAKQWTIVIVNDQHNHPITINNESKTATATAAATAAASSDNSLAYLNKLPIPIPTPNSNSNLNLNMNMNMNMNMNENFNNSPTTTINKNISLNLLHLEINNLLLNLNSNLSISNNLKEITYNKIINILKSLQNVQNVQSVQNFDFPEKKIFNSPPNGNENNSIISSNYSYNASGNNNGTDLQNFDKIILPSLNNFHTKFSTTNSTNNSNPNLNSSSNPNGNGLFSQFYM